MPEEKKLCLCGCDKEINIFDKRGKERFYILGHQLRGNKFRLGKPRPDLIERNKKGHTAESKLKISLAMKGKKYSPEHKKNISIARKGKYYPTEFKKGIHPKTEFQKGQKPWNYIDGRSKLKCPDRYGDDWDAIRLIVYMRDNYRCQECRITMNDYKRPLDIHHKIPFMISKDNSLNNLITLCRSCHMKVENQFIEQQKVMLYA